MAWVKLDDHFDEHDKVLAAGPDAMWVLLRGLAWCNRRETDGHIIPAALDRIGSEFGPQKRRKLAQRLVDVVLLHRPGHDCDGCPDPPDGWQVHDYSDYQPTKAKKESERAEARERMRAAREAKKARGSPDVRTEQDTNVTGSSVNPVPGPAVPDGTEPLAAAPRKPDLIWDAVIDACGLNPDELTKSARGAANKAVKELREIGATPAGIQARAGIHRRKWPDATLTPTSLAKNFAQLGATDKPAVSRPDPGRSDREAALAAAGLDDRRTA